MVVFQRLDKTEVAKIAKIQLANLQQRLADKELTLELTDSAMHLLVEHGYEPVYGARPMKRAIQQWIENPLAQHILGGDYLAGTNIVVDTKDGEFVFP